MANQFTFRDASASCNDAQFIADAMDSTIPHLVAAGNAGQWGTEPLSKKESFMQKMHDAASKSDQFCKTGTGDRERIFIAEVEDDQTDSDSTANGNLSRRMDENGKSFVSVGFVKIVEEQFGKFVFLQYLVTDHRVGDRRRGAGAALLQRVKDYTLERGWKRSGLIAGMEGFNIMGSFRDDDDDNGSSWNGKLFRMDLP
ncbi:hypothetical protein FAGAP_10161 [Fusarium agapanthi]|uniref:N-acetyltransferase domain-containing protein n=1 Tax=Fusarium agapanthi TaxID=1803897 RepID=A0A9P5B2T6_9HYPO|nr:hypothetical protein FAGAP_10161 [Fusarium agapanthi]